MSSGATGYDVEAWESMGYFYDTQAWLPKNVTFMNRAAFDQLDKPTQETMLKVAAAAEARGWWRSQDKTKWYMEQLVANGMKVLPPSRALKSGLQQIGGGEMRDDLIQPTQEPYFYTFAALLGCGDRRTAGLGRAPANTNNTAGAATRR
jgi:TRAP-type C4-dicarboxylate transport system substrate-binding protein